jgi:hypothetical protein
MRLPTEGAPCKYGDFMKIKAVESRRVLGYKCSLQLLA